MIQLESIEQDYIWILTSQSYQEMPSAQLESVGHGIKGSGFYSH